MAKARLTINKVEIDVEVEADESPLDDMGFCVYCARCIVVGEEHEDDCPEHPEAKKP